MTELIQRVDPRPAIRRAVNRLADFPQEQFATRYLHDLGLSWESVKGKKTLDLGAGSGEFGYIAKKKGVNVVSLDNGSQVKEFNKNLPNLVIGDVKNDLPFIESSFDLVIAHDSIHHFGDLYALFDRVRRVLKEEGEFRFNVKTRNQQGLIEKFFTIGKDPKESDQQIINEVVQIYEDNLIYNLFIFL